MTGGKIRSEEIGCWATLKQTSPFIEIFPDTQVPIVSIVPIIPREHGAPKCYLVDATKLDEITLNKIARVFLDEWGNECSSLQEMLSYLKKNFPLKTEHFSGCWTNSPAILFGLMDDYDFKTNCEEEEEDWLEELEQDDNDCEYDFTA